MFSLTSIERESESESDCATETTYSHRKPKSIRRTLEQRNKSFYGKTKLYAINFLWHQVAGQKVQLVNLFFCVLIWVSISIAARIELATNESRLY